MHHRYPYQLTSVEEDFRAIGLVPENQLTEEVELDELDNSQNPRDVPSPDPSTLGGLDNSGGSINTKAKHATGQQPRPAIAPSEKSDHDDPMSAGGTQKKGKNSGSYNKSPNMREGEEVGPDASHGYSKYNVITKKPGMKGASDNGKNPDTAEGLPSAKKIGGMSKHESGAVSRAAELMGEVEALLRGAQVDEDVNQLYRGFNLLGEDAALLADRLTEISDEYEVEHIVTAMEELSRYAIEMLDITEMADSLAENEEDDIDLEDVKRVFQVMTLDLMDAVEAYDQVIFEMSDKDDEDDDDEDDDEEDDEEDKKSSTKDKMAMMKAKMKARSGK